MNHEDNFIIEKATPADASSVASLAYLALDEYALYLADTDTPEIAQKYLEFAFLHDTLNEVHYSNFLVVKNQHGKIVGSTSFYEGKDVDLYNDGGWKVYEEYFKPEKTPTEPSHEKEADPDELYIDTIGIFPEYRGCGIIKKIFAHVEEIAKARKLPKVSLVAASHKKKLHNYYQKFGFQPTEERRLGGGRMYIHFAKKVS